MAKSKNKDLGSDILYRVVLAVLAAGSVLVAFFSKFIYAVVESDVLKIISSLQGKTDDDGSTMFKYSLKEIFDLVGSSSSDSGSETASKIWASLSDIHAAIICVAVFFIIALLIALTIFIFNIFSKKRLVALCLAGGGLLSLIAMMISFNAAASPILDGTISLATLFGSTSLFSGLLSYVASVSVFKLSSAWFLMLFMFIGMMVWAGAYMLIESGDKKVK